jgi:hypothetical protein
MVFLRIINEGRNGHFREWSALFETAGKLTDWNLEVIEFSKELSSTAPMFLLKRIEKLSPDHLFIEWIHDFEHIGLQLSDFLKSRNITWSCVAALSGMLRESNRDNQSQHPNYNALQILRHANKNENLKAIFVFDEFLVANNSDLPLVALPDHQNLTISKKVMPCCKFAVQKRPIVGIVGQLYGYRGVSNLLKYWIKNPRIKLLLAGAYDPRSISLFEKLLLVIARLTKSVYWHPHWLPTPGDVNHHLNHLSALYIDTSRYPYPSGVANRARFFGIPVIIENVDSYLRDQKLINCDSGIIFSNVLKRSNISDMQIQLASIQPFTNLTQVEKLYKALHEGWI